MNKNHNHIKPSKIHGKKWQDDWQKKLNQMTRKLSKQLQLDINVKAAKKAQNKGLGTNKKK